MKMSDIALLAASAAAVLLVMKAKGISLSTWTPWQKVTSYAGHQYFNDGTNGLVIDPAGRYILNGEVVWTPDRSDPKAPIP